MYDRVSEISVNILREIRHLFIFSIVRLSSSLAADKRSLRPQRRHKTGANPVKQLQQREDLIDESEVSNKPKVCLIIKELFFEGGCY